MTLNAHKEQLSEPSQFKACAHCVPGARGVLKTPMGLAMVPSIVEECRQVEGRYKAARAGVCSVPIHNRLEQAGTILLMLDASFQLELPRYLGCSSRSQ